MPELCSLRPYETSRYGYNGQLLQTNAIQPFEAHRERQSPSDCAAQSGLVRPIPAAKRRRNKAQGEAQRALGRQTAGFQAPNGGDGKTLRRTANSHPRKRWISKHSGMTAVACLCAFLGGCGEGVTDSNANGEEAVKPIVKTAEMGPVKMTVTADRDRITIAERLNLTIEVVAANGVDVDLGEPGDQLNEFQIRGFTNAVAEPVEGGRRWTRTYDLDIFLSGAYSIPELEARFTDRRQSGSEPAPTVESTSQPADRLDRPFLAREGVIRTEPFTIEVASLLEGDFDPTQFRDIKGPVELPVAAEHRWVAWAAGAATAVALVVLLVLIRRRRRARSEQKVTVVPHEWAFDQLRLLIDEKLVEQGLVHEFYFRLSHVVRVYIELRFGLMAPERTTEEFLVEVQRSDVLRDDHQTLLGDFLTSCDLVKFAKYEPIASEIELAFDLARDFIEQTVPHGAAFEPQAREEAA